MSRPLLAIAAALALLAAAVGLSPQRTPAGPDSAVVDLVRLAGSAGHGRALDELDRLARADRSVADAAHDIAHALGAHAYRTLGDIATAYGVCDDRFASGCQHGVVDAALRAKTPTDDIARFCGTLPSGDPVARQTCPHGLGHAVAHRAQGDLAQAALACDALAPELRSSCVTGAFMGGDPSVAPQTILDACLALVTTHTDACWRAYAARSFWSLGPLWPELGRGCEPASGADRAACYRTLGKLALGRDPGRSAEALAACALMATASEDRTACTAGLGDGPILP